MKTKICNASTSRSPRIAKTKKSVAPKQVSERKSYNDGLWIVDDLDLTDSDGPRQMDGQSTQDEGGFTKNFDEQDVGNRRS